MKKWIAILLLACVSGVQSVRAHDPADGPGEPKHGGQYVEFESHHGIELVTGQEALIFHMTEHLIPKDMTGSSFKVFLQRGDKTEVITAKADGTRLIAPLVRPVTTGDKIVLTGKDENKHALQARFVVK